MEYGRIILKGSGKQQYIKHIKKDTLSGKYKVVSLGIKIESIFFNDTNEWGKWIKDTHTDHNKLNEQIALFIIDKGYNKDLSTKQRFISLVQTKIIKNIYNIGTQRNYEVALNTFKQFLIDKYNIDDISINQLNRDILNGYSTYLSNKHTHITAHNKLNIIKIFISKLQGIDINIITNTKKLNIKKTDSVKYYLTENQLYKLKHIPIQQTKKGIDLDGVRNMLLFSIYGSGIRVSDLLELSYSNFIVKDNNIHIVKRDKKTNKPNTYQLSDYSITFLSKQISNLFTPDTQFTYNDYTFDNNKLIGYIKQVSGMKKIIQNEQIKNIDESEYGTLLKQVNNEISKHTKTALLHIIKHKKFKNNYIFCDYFNPANLSDLEIFKAHSRARAAYRRNIATLAGKNYLDLDFTPTPHTPRYTLASILYKNGVDTATIQKLLNHKDISTTQKYIAAFSKQFKNDNLIIENILNHLK